MNGGSLGGASDYPVCDGEAGAGGLRLSSRPRGGEVGDLGFKLRMLSPRNTEALVKEKAMSCSEFFFLLAFLSNLIPSLQ